jgi:hypothetical protein
MRHRGGGPMAMPQGAAPTRIVATTFNDAVSMTETSFVHHGSALRIDDGHRMVAFARDVYGCSIRNRTPSGSPPTSTVRSTLPVSRSMLIPSLR